ncbi:MAG TPA: SDR family NAD(P)-dependent oxidoreductase [Clostridiaceae bacterium]|nr:SDR family NAD(P)-dependent oxidoreductase [Clostridiaceae bacterium]
MMGSKKNIAVITGASSGIGLEFAKQLDSHPGIDEIWLCARRENRLQDLTQSLNKTTKIIAGDVTDLLWQNRLHQELEQNNVQIHTLINSAGMGKKGTVEEIGCENNAYMIDLNCRALTVVCSICIPFMAIGGRILNLASVAAFLPQPRFAVYAATKAYVLSYSRALHRELKSKQITVTAVCPNPIETEFFNHTGKPHEISSLKRIGLEQVEKVVAKALRRSKCKKDISLQSVSAKFVRIVARILPHPFILWIEEKIGL